MNLRYAEALTNQMRSEVVTGMTGRERGVHVWVFIVWWGLANVTMGSGIGSWHTSRGLLYLLIFIGVSSSWWGGFIQVKCFVDRIGSSNVYDSIFQAILLNTIMTDSIVYKGRDYAVFTAINYLLNSMKHVTHSREAINYTPNHQFWFSRSWGWHYMFC